MIALLEGGPLHGEEVTLSWHPIALLVPAFGGQLRYEHAGRLESGAFLYRYQEDA
jgi:hypothetical protein